MPKHFWTEYHMVCRWCGTSFTAVREDAEYCSATCRKQKQRAPAKYEKIAQEAADSLHWMKKNGMHYSQHGRKQVVEDLRKLAARATMYADSLEQF